MCVASFLHLNLLHLMDSPITPLYVFSVEACLLSPGGPTFLFLQLMCLIINLFCHVL